jgi:hypothetical protein
MVVVNRDRLMTQVVMCEEGSVGTFEERIEWIKDNRGFKSGRAISTAAGLSPSTVNNIAMRERETGKLGADAETIARLAETARVNARWLLTGEGTPDERGSGTMAAIEPPALPTNPDIDPGVMKLVKDDLTNPKKFPQYPSDLVFFVLGQLRWKHSRAITYTDVMEAAREDMDLMLERGEWPLK